MISDKRTQKGGSLLSLRIHNKLAGNEIENRVCVYVWSIKSHCSSVNVHWIINAWYFVQRVGVSRDYYS